MWRGGSWNLNTLSPCEPKIFQPKRFRTHGHIGHIILWSTQELDTKMPALQKGEAVEISAETQLISVELSYGWDLWWIPDGKEWLWWIGFRSNLRSTGWRWRGVQGMRNCWNFWSEEFLQNTFKLVETLGETILLKIWGIYMAYCTWFEMAVPFSWVRLKVRRESYVLKLDVVLWNRSLAQFGSINRTWPNGRLTPHGKLMEYKDESMSKDPIQATFSFIWDCQHRKGKFHLEQRNSRHRETAARFSEKDMVQAAVVRSEETNS